MRSIWMRIAAAAIGAGALVALSACAPARLPHDHTAYPYSGLGEVKQTDSSRVDRHGMRVQTGTDDVGHASGRVIVNRPKYRP